MESGTHNDYFTHLFMTKERKIWPCLYDCVCDAPERKMRRRLFYLVNLDGGKCSESNVNNFNFVLKHFLIGKTTYMCHPDPDKYLSNEILYILHHDITVDVMCDALERKDKKWGLLHCREEDVNIRMIANLILDNRYTLDII